MRSVIILAVLGACLVIGPDPPDAHANGYGEAKRLLLRADTAFKKGDTVRALSLLRQVLAHQTEVSGSRRQYGYAAYAHLRLAMHHAEHKRVVQFINTSDPRVSSRNSALSWVPTYSTRGSCSDFVGSPTRCGALDAVQFKAWSRSSRVYGQYPTDVHQSIPLAHR